MVKSFPLAYAARTASRDAKGRSARDFAAFALRYASVMLERLALQMDAADDAAISVGVAGNTRMPAYVEFYAEAGAAEGAIYADGQLIGFLPGVKRL